MVQWEHAAHVSDFQSERGFESRQVQQFFAQRVALRTDTICLPKPSHYTTWNGPLNRKTFGAVNPLSNDRFERTTAGSRAPMVLNYSRCVVLGSGPA